MAKGRYQCNLSPDLLEVAVNELNEPRDNEERLLAIDQLRSSFNEGQYGPIIRDDDAFLLQFLRAKKFDQTKALIVLHNYHSVRKEFKEVFEKVSNPAILRPVAEKGVMFMLDGEAKNGSAVMLTRSGLIDGSDDIYAIIAYGVFSIEKLLEEEQYQICGISSIRDLKDFSLMIYTKFSPMTLGKMTKIWQDAMPIRFKASHILNEGTVFDIAMKIFRPFIKKKLLKRIHVHGSNYAALQEYIDPSVLPPSLDGTGSNVDELAKRWLDKVIEDWPQDTAL